MKPRAQNRLCAVTWKTCEHERNYLTTCINIAISIYLATVNQDRNKSWRASISNCISASRPEMTRATIIESNDIQQFRIQLSAKPTVTGTLPTSTCYQLIHHTLWLCQNSYWKWPIYSWFTHKKRWFSIAMLVYQRVLVQIHCKSREPVPPQRVFLEGSWAIMSSQPDSTTNFLDVTSTPKR